MSEYTIEDRGGIRVLAWTSGGCRPATETEADLWDRLESALAGEAVALEEVEAWRDRWDRLVAKWRKYDEQSRADGRAEADARWQAKVAKVRAHRRITAEEYQASNCDLYKQNAVDDALEAVLTILDGEGECVCGETSARNCPEHGR